MGLTLECQPVDLIGCLAVIAAGIGLNDAGIDGAASQRDRVLLERVSDRIGHLDGWGRLVEGSFTRRARFSCAYGTPHSRRQAGDLQI